MLKPNAQFLTIIEIPYKFQKIYHVRFLLLCVSLLIPSSHPFFLRSVPDTKNSVLAKSNLGRFLAPSDQNERYHTSFMTGKIAYERNFLGRCPESLLVI